MSKKHFKKTVGSTSNYKQLDKNKEAEQDNSKSYWEKLQENSKPELLYGSKHFLLIGIGLGLIIIGFFLMSGGAMPDANTWDPGIIFSNIRITFAPFIVLLGLAVVGYALFYNSKDDNDLESIKEKENTDN